MLRIRLAERIEKGPDAGKTVFEATLTPENGLRLGAGDLVRLVLSLRDRRVDLFATLEVDQEMAGGEFRLRGSPAELSEELSDALIGSEGRSLTDVVYQRVVARSTPSDLYALAVLGVRTLLVDDSLSLAVAVDELASLARRVDEEEQGTLVERIGRVFASDERWGKSLGAHRLVLDDVSVSEAGAWVPDGLWHEVLALLVTMIPGGKDSIARDLGDAPPGAPHVVFEGVQRALGLLMDRSLGLMLVDWSANREASGVIRRYLALQ